MQCSLIQTCITIGKIGWICKANTHFVHMQLGSTLEKYNVESYTSLMCTCKSDLYSHNHNNDAYKKLMITTCRNTIVKIWWINPHIELLCIWVFSVWCFHVDYMTVYCPIVIFSSSFVLYFPFHWLFLFEIDIMIS